MSAEPAATQTPGAAESGTPGLTPPAITGAGRRFLSDLIVELGFVEESTVTQAVEAARRPGMTVERVLLDQGSLTQDQLARALAERYGLDHVNLEVFEVDRSAAGLLHEGAARRYAAVPVGFADDGSLIVAVADPSDSLGLSDIAVMTKLAVRPAVAARTQIEALIESLEFMEEPTREAAPQGLGTLIMPPSEHSGATSAPMTISFPVPTAPARDGGADSAHLTRLEAELAAERERHSRELDELRQSLQGTGGEVGAKAADLQAALDQARAAHAEEAADLRRRADEAAAARAAEVAELRRQAEDVNAKSAREVAELRDIIETERVKRDETVAELRNSLEIERTTHDATVAELRAGTKAAAARHDEEVTSLRRALKGNHAGQTEEVTRLADALKAEATKHLEELAELTSAREQQLREVARLEAELADLRTAQGVDGASRDEIERLQAQLEEAAAERLRLRDEAEQGRESAEEAIRLRAELEQAQAGAAATERLTTELEELRQAASDLEALRAELERVRAETGDGSAARSQLEAARAELERVKADKADAERAAGQLDEAKARLEDLEDADRRAEQARQALADLRSESERQAELHGQAERDLKDKLAATEREVEELRGRFDSLAAALEGVKRPKD